MTEMFKQHAVTSLAEVAPFGEWLDDCVRRKLPVAFVARERSRKLAFSTLDDSWEVDLKSVAGPLAVGILRTLLLQRGNIDLYLRDAARDLPEAVRLLSREFSVEAGTLYRALAPLVLGDLTSAGICVNQEVQPHGKFKRLADDAFSVALLTPQYEHGIARYYSAIALPLAKLRAEREFQGKHDPEWYVTYEHLWVRVLAFYTGDPTLGYAFSEGRDPLEAVAHLLHISNQEAELLLLFYACGKDMQVFSKRFGNRVRDLPDSINEWVEKGRRFLPNIEFAVNGMMQNYADTRVIETRYGRRLRPGALMGEAVAFRIFGTVEELCAICAVTLHNNRSSSDTLVTEFKGGPAATVVQLAGVGPKIGDQPEWLRNVKELATLGNPLGNLPLRPSVFQP